MIRRFSDGLFSGGGTRPPFNKTGKVWRRATLKSHLTMVADNLNRYNSRYPGNPMPWPYEGCDIIRLIEDTSIEPTPVKEFA
jgi:hypothetical protein